MDALTLDQVRVFIAVTEAGSFSKAAKQLNRAQSAVTHAIRRLEVETGIPVFDRSAYRPTLTEAGKTLLVRARRIAEEASGFRDQARGLARGLEPELRVAIDPMAPTSMVTEALKAFSVEFPHVPVRVQVRPMGAGALLVSEGDCAIGLLPSNISELTPLRFHPLLAFDLLPVAAPSHPLASHPGRIPARLLHEQVQLVLTDTSDLTSGKELGVLSSRTWRIADLGAKKAMLLAGLGWGNMPEHLVEAELRSGDLVRIDPEGFAPVGSQLVIGAALSRDHSLGPAGTWMLAHFLKVADAEGKSA